MRVLYFWVRDPNYPRNARIRKYLAHQLGASVTVVEATAGQHFSKYLSAFRASLAADEDYDIVVLSEFSLMMAPFAAIAAKRSGARLVVDYFVGLEETEVGDFASTSTHSLRARVLRLVDRTAVALASFCFTDTQVRARRFESHFGEANKFAHLPVGAPAWSRRPGTRMPPKALGATRLLYYGSYLPLHGIPLWLASLNRADFAWQATFVGEGPGRREAEEIVDTLGLRRQVRFLESVPEAELRDLILGHDVVLGLLGTSEKAASVIANKVWQSLSLGKVVINRQSPALDEIRHIAGVNLVTIEEIGVAQVVQALSSSAELARGTSDEADRVGDELESYTNDIFKKSMARMIAVVSARGR